MKKLLARILSVFSTQHPTSQERREIDVPALGRTEAHTEFQPLNDIERLLVLAAGNPARRPEFKDALLTSDLYAATPDGPDVAESCSLQAGEKLKILNVTGPSGALVPAVFTSQARIAQVFGPGHGFLRINGEELLALFTGSGVFLNPGLSYGVFWNAEDLAALLGKMLERTLQEDTRVFLGVPAEPPDALIRYLQTELAREPIVKEAWLALAHWPNTSERSWYLDVRSDAPTDDTRGVMAKVLKGTSFDRYPIDLSVNRLDVAARQGIRIKPLTSH